MAAASEYQSGWIPGLTWKTEYRFSEYDRADQRRTFVNGGGFMACLARYIGTFSSDKLFVQTVMTSLVCRFNFGAANSPVVARVLIYARLERHSKAPAGQGFLVPRSSGSRSAPLQHMSGRPTQRLSLDLRIAARWPCRSTRALRRCIRSIRRRPRDQACSLRLAQRRQPGETGSEPSMRKGAADNVHLHSRHAIAGLLWIGQGTGAIAWPALELP